MAASALCFKRTLPLASVSKSVIVLASDAGQTGLSRLEMSHLAGSPVVASEYSTLLVPFEAAFAPRTS